MLKLSGNPEKYSFALRLVENDPESDPIRQMMPIRLRSARMMSIRLRIRHNDAFPDPLK